MVIIIEDFFIFDKNKLMKKIHLTFLFLLMNFSAFSQNIEELKKETSKFYEAHYNMDFNKIVDLYHPNYLIQTDRKSIINSLDILFQDDYIGIRYVFPVMSFTYEPIQKIGKAEYCIIKFKNSIRHIFSEKRQESQVKIDLDAYKSMSNLKSVKYEDNRNSYFIEQYETWIAVKSSETNGKWKFVELKTKIKFENELISPEILKSLGL